MKKTFIISVFSLMAGLVNSQDYIRIGASFYSSSLDMIRKVDIYLPGDYYLQTDKEFPVIYYLHGGGGNQSSGFHSAMTYYSTHYADSAVTSPAAIFVCPDGSCPPYTGCMWVNSPLYGNYEDYVINDLREFILTNFRVLTGKNFQFIHGLSMGGFGSAYLAARHPDLFRAACPSAGAFTWPDTLLNAWRSYLYNENNGYHFNYNAGQYTQVYFTLCGGFSPDTAMPPWYFESLYDTLGHVVESVYSRWKGFMSADMIRDISPENNLAFFLICGIEDELSFFPSNLEFTDTLQKYGRHYRTAWHNSGHSTFDPVSHQKMFHWVDSLIMEAYSHLDVPEANQDPALLNLICFPNPFSTEVQFTFTLPHACQVTLQMFHVDGKFVAEVARGEMGTGGHQITWSDTGILPGVYVCRLHAGEQTVVKRIIKL